MVGLVANADGFDSDELADQGQESMSPPLP